MRRVFMDEKVFYFEKKSKALSKESYGLYYC